MTAHEVWAHLRSGLAFHEWRLPAWFEGFPNDLTPEKVDDLVRQQADLDAGVFG